MRASSRSAQPASRRVPVSVISRSRRAGPPAPDRLRRASVLLRGRPASAFDWPRARSAPGECPRSRRTRRATRPGPKKPERQGKHRPLGRRIREPPLRTQPGGPATRGRPRPQPQGRRQPDIRQIDDPNDASCIETLWSHRSERTLVYQAHRTQPRVRGQSCVRWPGRTKSSNTNVRCI